MDRIRKLIRQNDSERETSWELKQDSTHFKNDHEFYRAIWDDEASRSIWNRYIIPVEEDSFLLLDYKNLVVENSQSMIDLSSAIIKADQQVFFLDEEIAQQNRRADQEITTSATNYEKAKEHQGVVLKETHYSETRAQNISAEQTKFNNIYSRRKSCY